MPSEGDKGDAPAEAKLPLQRAQSDDPVTIPPIGLEAEPDGLSGITSDGDGSSADSKCTISELSDTPLSESLLFFLLDKEATSELAARPAFIPAKELLSDS
mmetsp:Transcript_34696/g.81353  ORF Transcript_34696/g.81353 Transcript_34696/m.81353 type:complete len:101 (+) Transcript_34696:689-991(+)